MGVRTLSEALQLSDECRVITTGSAPFNIVHTNKGARTSHAELGAHIAQGERNAATLVRREGRSQAARMLLLRAAASPRCRRLRRWLFPL